MNFIHSCKYKNIATLYLLPACLLKTRRDSRSLVADPPCANATTMQNPSICFDDLKMKDQCNITAGFGEQPLVTQGLLKVWKYLYLSVFLVNKPKSV